MLEGRLSRRGAVRVHRIAWTVADLRGVDAPSISDVDTAFRLRMGDPVAGRGDPAAGLVSESERLARIALCRLTEPGDHRVAHLVAELGAVRLFGLLRDERDAGGLLTEVATRLRGIDPAADLERAQRLGIRYVVPGDPEWPSQVDDLICCASVDARGGPPLGLWVRGPGRLDRLDHAVAVVGSRQATTYGAEVAQGIAGVLARADWSWSRVLPTASTRRLTGAPSASRAPTSPSWPVASTAPTRRRTGPCSTTWPTTALVVAEVPPGCAPTRGRFLSRNRLIAALTRGTVVVEAAIRSGALNTAGWTTRLNRHLMGVPGPVTSAQSQGVHQLIRTGEAILVTQGSEVLEMVGDVGTHLVDPAPRPVHARATRSARGCNACSTRSRWPDQRRSTRSPPPRGSGWSRSAPAWGASNASASWRPPRGDGGWPPRLGHEPAPPAAARRAAAAGPPT